MTLELDRPVTDATLWSGTALLVVIDSALVPLVHRLIPTSRFKRLRILLPVVSGVFWAAIWLWAMATFWRSVYSFVFPASLRWVLPPAFGLFYAFGATILFRLATRAGRYAAVGFVLFGAVLGPITHVFAVWRGIVTKPPLMSGASPVAAVAVSFPEFGLYWCVILLLALVLLRIKEGHQENDRAGV
jgi:hypothetical protein